MSVVIIDIAVFVVFVFIAMIEVGRPARESGFDAAGGTLRRSSSRFCLGAEHGNYNDAPFGSEPR